MSTEDQEVRQWLYYASEDLAYGKLGRTDLPRAAAWSFQQAAEKALKALWLKVYREVPRTHDVAFLLSKLSETFETPEEVRDAILLLARITPAVRYPGDDQPAISTGDAEEYAEAAEMAYQWPLKAMVSWTEFWLPHYVCEVKRGEGAVREFADAILDTLKNRTQAKPSARFLARWRLVLRSSTVSSLVQLAGPQGGSVEGQPLRKPVPKPLTTSICRSARRRTRRSALQWQSVQEGGTLNSSRNRADRATMNSLIRVLFPFARNLPCLSA